MVLVVLVALLYTPFGIWQGRWRRTAGWPWPARGRWAATPATPAPLAGPPRRRSSLRWIGAPCSVATGFGVASFAVCAVTLFEVFAAAISSFTSMGFEITEAASSRGLALQQQAEVTRVVTIRAVLAALKHNSRFIVPVTAP